MEYFQLSIQLALMVEQQLRGVINTCREQLLKIVQETEVSRYVSAHIRIKFPCNLHPLTPHFYIVKLEFTGVYIIFLFLF